MSPTSRRDRTAGFTLLELLVAITLLGLLMAALLGGLRLGARVWERSEERLEATSRVQVVQGFLRGRIAEALPFEVMMLAEDGGIRFSFSGAPDELRFASALPEQLGAGIHLLQLTVGEGGVEGERRDLVLRWQPLNLDDTVPDDPPEPEERVLIEDIAGLEMAYFGSLNPREAPAWWPEWPARQDTFPGLVRVQVRFAADDLRRWPELVVAPMVDRAPLH